MSSTTQTTAPQFPFVPSDLGDKALEAISAFAEANQRVVGQMIELGSAAAAERLRALGEIQSAAMEAARASLPAGSFREGLEELRRDPLAWYRKGMTSALEGAQRALRLFETSAQIATKSAERFQGPAERAGKEIQDAMTSYGERMRNIYEARPGSEPRAN
jgi:hypothetical protein